VALLTRRLIVLRGQRGPPRTPHPHSVASALAQQHSGSAAGTTQNVNTATVGLEGRARPPELLSPSAAVRPPRLDRLRRAMSPATVHQTLFDPANGNSLQACVASLFNLPLGDVPNFLADAASSGGYAAAIARFVRPSGWTPRKVPLGSATSGCGGLGDGTVVILRGQSPRGTHGHVVLARVRGGGGGAGLTAAVGNTDADTSASRFDYIMDPHPDGTYLDGTAELGWAMVFEPSEDAPVAVLAGGAQRLASWIHTTTPWQLLPCESLDEVEATPKDDVLALLIGPQFEPHLPKVLHPAFFPRLGLIQSLSAG
jgi:hypothetical protein